MDVEFLLYLDHGDLSDIADGKARDVAELRDALDYANASILVSCAHILDLAGADDDTRERWLDAVHGLGPVRFAAAPGPGQFVPRAFLARTFEEVSRELAVAREAMLVVEDTFQRVHALGVHKLPRPPVRRVREVLSALFDDDKLASLGLTDQQLLDLGLDRTALRSGIEELGLTVDGVAATAFATPDEALNRGDVVEFVRRRRRDDRGRPGRQSDAGDEVHLAFALRADVFTVDANVEHILRSIHGRPMTVEGRTEEDGNRVICFRNGQLLKVADALCMLADDWRDTHHEVANGGMRADE